MVDNVDIASVASLKGVGGTVAKKSATEITYSLNAGNCQAFSLVLAKGIKSGSNNEASEAWNFDSRTICGTSSIIGYSVKGRPITAYSFGSGSTVILFTAGIHGSEPSSTTTLQAWVEYLKVNGYTIPSNKRLVIVPNTNPDGIASNTRNNSRDVNIDRNFPTANWSASIESANGTLPMGGGAHPGSEPETTALINLTRQLRPRLSVAFHAQGRLVGANKVADSVAIGSVYASTVGYKTMYDNAEAIMGYTITGEYEDWMGEELRIPAILIELPSSAGNNLSSQLTALWKMVTI
jgi:protein MpaA